MCINYANIYMYKSCKIICNKNVFIDPKSMNNNYKTNKISQENIIQSKQKKKKRKLALKETR